MKSPKRWNLLYEAEDLELRLDNLELLSEMFYGYDRY
jgi:hypothetical protein